MALSTTAESVGGRLQLNGQQYCFVRAKDGTRFTYVDPNGEIMCGSYDHFSERVRPGTRHVRLHTLMYPTPAEWDLLLPLIGYTESVNVFTPIDSLTAFDAQVDYDGTDVGNYRDGVIDVAIARGQQGLTPVSLELQMVFQDYDLDSAFSATAAGFDAPYEFTSGVLGLDSTAGNFRDFNSFVWVHNNHVRPRFNNTVTATNLANTQRTMHLAVNTPYTAGEDDLLITGMSDTNRLTGQDASLAFTQGAQSLTWAFENLKWETKPPDILKKDEEIRLMQTYKCYATNGNPVVSITNVP